MSQPTLHKVLVVDDEPGILSALRRTLLEDYIVLAAPSGEEALELLRRNEDISVILTDQRMPGMSGAEFLEKSVDVSPDSQRVVLTGYTDMEDVVRMINAGKVDYYLTKPWETNHLKVVLRRSCETWQLERENRRLLYELQLAHSQLQKENLELKTEVAGRFSFQGIVGTSRAMRETLDFLRKVLVTETTVLLLGETGSGKEVLARALHYAGPRAQRPFVAQNCAALAESLLASELFGHVRGSFTGAVRDKKGLFEQADGGTIFLDEIGEVSLGFQQQLLRVLQEGEITPVGGEKTIKVNVRVVAATNRDLEAEVKAGRFREDLYFRLAVFPIRVPPLRERKEDIPLLVDHFLAQLGGRMGRPGVGMNPDALERLAAWRWPGNVRELENEIERALVLVEPGGTIGPDLLSPKLLSAPVESAAPHPSNGGAAPSGEAEVGTLASRFVDKGREIKDVVEELEQAILHEAIRRFEGNKARIARALGLSRMGLDKKLGRYGIGVARGPSGAEEDSE
ncbi:MAG: sigma-54 dependent transcriptional regulator [Bdellovibrionota bacterium]